MKLTNKLIDLMVTEKKLGPVIVGPHKHRQDIGNKFRNYNNTRGTSYRFRQRRILAVDPRTHTTNEMWQVSIIEEQNEKEEKEI